MTDTWWFNLIVTLLIIAASGFFVVIEFSLMGARRNRLGCGKLPHRPRRPALAQ